MSTRTETVAVDHPLFRVDVRPWERTAGGHLARVRLAGPVSARAWLSSGDLGAQLRNESHRGCVAIFWDSDAPDRSDDPTDRRWVEIIHALQSYTEECV